MAGLRNLIFFIQQSSWVKKHEESIVSSYRLRKGWKKIKNKNKITDLIIFEYKNTKYKIDFEAKKKLFFFLNYYILKLFIYFFFP